MSEAKPPSATLRRIAESIAEDIGQAPIRSPNGKALSQTIQDFVSLERSMTATSDTMRRAGNSLEVLRKEFQKWDSAPDATAALKEKLDDCFRMLNLPHEDSTSNTDTA